MAVEVLGEVGWSWKPTSAATRATGHPSHRQGITLVEAGRILEVSPAHLVRSFTSRFGISPHRYLIGRRIEAARRQLLDGLEEPRIEEVPDVLGNRAAGWVFVGFAPLTQVRAAPRRARLTRPRRCRRVDEGPVRRPEASDERRIEDVRLIDGRADLVLAEDLGSWPSLIRSILCRQELPSG